MMFKPFNQIKVVWLVIGTFFLSSLSFFLWPAYPAGFKISFIRPLTDSELYLSKFNQTMIGKLLIRNLHDVFGFYLADLIAVCFSIFTLGAIAYLIFQIIEDALIVDRELNFSRTRVRCVSGIAALIFAFYSAELFAFARMTQLYEYSGIFGTISNAFMEIVSNASGSVFVRFYQPGLAIMALLLGIQAVEKLTYTEAFVGGKETFLILAVTGWALSNYPWIGLAFFAYLCLSIVILYQHDLHKAVLIVSSVIVLTSFFLYLTYAIGNGSDDYLNT